MPYSALHRRYDGPIPRWELPHRPVDCRRFHRLRAVDAAKSMMAELRKCAASAESQRLWHWHNAVRLLDRFFEERTAHRRAIR